MGGTAAWEPMEMTTPRRARSVRAPSTVTSFCPVILPRPRTSVPPLSVNLAAATLSFQLSVASSRMRRATGAQSGVMAAPPAIPGIRLPSASRPAARIIILDGTHPQ